MQGARQAGRRRGILIKDRIQSRDSVMHRQRKLRGTGGVAMSDFADDTGGDVFIAIAGRPDDIIYRVTCVCKLCQGAACRVQGKACQGRQAAAFEWGDVINPSQCRVKISMGDVA